jgi:hypothetical protein
MSKPNIEPGEFAKKIDNKYSLALKSRKMPSHLIANINLQKFLRLYRENNEYYGNKEDENKLLFYLSDIIFELYLLGVDGSLYNTLLYAGHYTKEEIKNSSRLLLIHLSLDQSVILKSTILIERIMDFVYYLETKNELEGKHSDLKYKAMKANEYPTSKKNIFFDEIKSTHWKYFLAYKQLFEEYNQQLRNPEVHLSSSLADKFNRSPNINLNYSDKIGTLRNFALNMLWQPLIQILNGKNITNVSWVEGMKALAEITIEDLQKVILNSD